MQIGVSDSKYVVLDDTFLVLAFYICCFVIVNIPVIYLWCFFQLEEGPKISKLGHVTQATTIYGTFHGPHAGGIRPLCLHQIWRG